MKLSKDYAKLYNDIMSNLEINQETGDVYEKEPYLTFLKYLPSSISKEMVRSIFNYNDIFDEAMNKAIDDIIAETKIPALDLHIAISVKNSPFNNLTFYIDNSINSSIAIDTPAANKSTEELVNKIKDDITVTSTELSEKNPYHIYNKNIPDLINTTDVYILLDYCTLYLKAAKKAANTLIKKSERYKEKYVVPIIENEKIRFY